MIALIDSPKCSPGTGLFMIQHWVAGQRRLGIPAPIPIPASPHQHWGPNFNTLGGQRSRYGGRQERSWEVRPMTDRFPSSESE